MCQYADKPLAIWYFFFLYEMVYKCVFLDRNTNLRK